MGINRTFKEVNDYAAAIQHQIGATAAAVYVIQKDSVVNEWYAGFHGAVERSRKVDEYSQFNVGSVRKTYLALAISLLIEQGEIGGIDDEIGTYLPSPDALLVQGTTLRHLLTHTHGLHTVDGKLIRKFPSGQSWYYTNTGIHMLIELVTARAGRNLADYMREHVFLPMGLTETGWRTASHEQLVYNMYDEPDARVGPNWSPAGDQSNLFTSARELAAWGDFHLRRGWHNGRQIIPEAVFDRITAVQTPNTLPGHLPRHGFIWWMQHHSPLNEIGERLPPGAFQMLGITGCACLAIPECEAVAVRMYNQLHNPPGYDYLADIRRFGDLVYERLTRG
jgi:CubicO group peptidase (beta-lactamase class C family)